MLFDEVVNNLEENKQKREQGKVIAIPFPFKRFSKYIPGVQQGRYIICTASTKVGKTKFADFLFVYGLLDWLEKNPNAGIDIRINYFCLESSKIDKMKEAISYYLFTRKNIVLPPDKMDSIYEDYILSDTGIVEIKSLRSVFQFFESKVKFHDSIRNPFGIYKEIRSIAHAEGHYEDSEGNILSTQAIEKGDLDTIRKLHSYVPDNPDIYYINIFDHFGLLQPEKHHYGKGDPLRECIKEFSSRHCLMMRDRWKHTVIGIQQQANAQESVENYRLNKLRPTGNGLADCKDTQRDVDMMLGLFSPARHELVEWLGYDIEFFADQYRELSVILNRRGNTPITSLWFNGASNYFKELPRVEDKEEITKVMKETKTLRSLLYGN